MKEIIILLNILLVILTGCKKPTEPPPPPPPAEEPTLTLELDDAHCTEVWILFKSTNLLSTIGVPNSITLKQFNPNGDSLIQTINLITPDTLLYIDSLLPKKTYRFKTEATVSFKQYATNELIVQTMDTTSHNFTFEMITFGGEAGSCVLHDVAIINENNIIACGEIFMKDSLGNPDPQGFGIAKWNGERWELKKLFYNNSIIISPIRGIFVLKPDEIYLAAGSVFRWDGVSSQAQLVYSRLSLPDPNATIEKLWGKPNGVYGVGNRGTIIYYNGTSWRRIESNTTLNINDIWGDYNPITNEWEILAVASNKFLNEGSAVIKIEGSISKELNRTGLPWSLSSVWFKSHKKYFIGGDGLFFNKKINDNWKKDTTFIPIYKDRIRGISINDIIVSGSNGLLSHFNGYSWRHFINNELPYYSGRLLSVDLKQNVTVAVGWIGSQAIITIGKR